MKKFIRAYQDISELNSEIHSIKQSVVELQGEVINRIIKIRSIMSKVYNTASNGRVCEIIFINKSTVCFEVSYCGCCENNEEELDEELLLMNDNLVQEHFEEKKKIADDKKLKEKNRKDTENEHNLELHDKSEYKRLKKKYGEKQ